MSVDSETQLFGTEKIWRLLLKFAPPIMFAQLIQAFYNIVDSYFVGKYSAEGITALSVIFPIQLIICALGIGTGTGVNTVMAKLYGLNRQEDARKTAGAGTALAVVSWIIFAVIAVAIMKKYVSISADSPSVHAQALIYGDIVCAFSLGIFLESIWTKVHQAKGNMVTPMIAQVCGALTNIILDPILIFGRFGLEPMGIAGAAIATVIGQTVAAIITFKGGFYLPPKIKESGAYIREIYRLGLPNMIMQVLYTVYIVGLNVILSGFCDEAVMVLGLYYKIQSFFFIPLLGLEICIVPMLSYNYAIRRYDRCRRILWESSAFVGVMMLVGVIAFEWIPDILIGFFVRDAKVIEIGTTALRIIALSFLPAVLSLMFPYFFQAIGMGKRSVAVTIMRHIVLFVPVAWLLSFWGLNYVWITFPITEVGTGALGLYFYILARRKQEI